MPSLISSPVAYPASSSPPSSKRPLPAFAARIQHGSEHAALIDIDGEERANKRRMLSDVAAELIRAMPAKEKSHSVSRRVGAFVDDESDEENAPVNLPTTRTLDAFVDVNSDEVETMLDETHSRRPFKHCPPDDHQSPDPPATVNAIHSSAISRHFANRREVMTCGGKSLHINPRQKTVPVSFEQLAAGRSKVKAGRAKKSYYGIDVQELIAHAIQNVTAPTTQTHAVTDAPLPTTEAPVSSRSKKSLMWTEKYRARKFFDLVGDDRTHREVLRWLKGWDPVVFPRSGKPKPVTSKRPGEPDEKPHRKILMLTGPPGLGKTTLAHVCASQAGYEIMEINASDDRSSNVVKGRIRTSVGTESVKNVGTTSKNGTARPARPVCVVVDEVDGVVGGSSASGEGGFIKALIDLIQLDAKNTAASTIDSNNNARRKKKSDDFRLLRPIIMICNDVYHPSLRPLRQSSFAEVIHIRKPPLEAVVKRMKYVFEREGVTADNDAVRKLCEAAWGMSSGPEARYSSNGTGEGDIRSVLVIGEWAASKLKSLGVSQPRLTTKWVDENMLGNLGQGGSSTRGVGRGGPKEVVSRVFITGAGFPKPVEEPLAPLAKSSVTTDVAGGPKTQLHASEVAKKLGMERLREMVDTSGDTDRIVTDIFAAYPTQDFNDDTLLTKPNSAYDWLHFSDVCSSRVWSEQDFELMPYLSQPVLAAHSLFAMPMRHYHSFEKRHENKWGNDADEEVERPFSGPRADYDAKEAEKQSRAVLLELQSSLNPALLRAFRSPEDIATDLLPYLVRLLSPDIKPVVVGGGGDAKGVASVRKESEKAMVKRAVDVMGGVGVKYERGKLDGDYGSRGTQWVYRMEPPLDEQSTFATLTKSSGSNTTTRYAVCQVLDQEHAKAMIERENEARKARFRAGGNGLDDDSYSFTVDPSGKSQMKKLLEVDGVDDAAGPKIKKDFFGRTIEDDLTQSAANRESAGHEQASSKEAMRRKHQPSKKVWVTYHEGYSNAVRKPISVEELLRSL